VLDAGTKKPIQGAFITINWREFESGRKSRCVLDEFGVTDVNGRFSTQGKDGSWAVGEWHASALDHSAFATDSFSAEEKIKRKVSISRMDPDYRVWIERLLAAGYAPEFPGSTRLTKTFDFGLEDFDGRRNPMLEKGQLVLLSNDPNTPETLHSDGVGNGCARKSSSEPFAPKKGLSEAEWQEFRRLFISIKSFQAACDPAWGSLPSDSKQSAMLHLLSQASALVSPDFDAHAPFMREFGLELQTDPLRRGAPATTEQWASMCSALEPFAKKARERLENFQRLGAL
jgi:hypothetical protein